MAAERYSIASSSYTLVSEKVYVSDGTILRMGTLEPSGLTSETDLTALRSFHTSRTRPKPDERRIIHDVSLSIRYKKITVWKKRLISIERKDSPFIDLLFFQKEMSFLKASMSKSVCSIETNAVTARSHGEVSVIIRRISSMVLSPCTVACCSREVAIWLVSIQRIRLVTVKVSCSWRVGVVVLIGCMSEMGHQKSLRKSTGAWRPLSSSMSSAGRTCGGMRSRLG
mmetsp:Transcript_59264/g.117718  ORF Transcript_59264/g.117718 Transcript_59264/m.117718 type:complete len:226 (-) Transcript_59264:13-690(-)